MEEEKINRKEMNLLLQVGEAKQEQVWCLIKGFAVGFGAASGIWLIIAIILTEMSR